MTRGGKREGAGRPKQEKVKKMFSFRLSEEEEKAVRELLAKMRGHGVGVKNSVFNTTLRILFICLFALCLPVFADTLHGNITYTEETARQEAFKDVKLIDETYKVKPKRYFLDIKNINNNTDILTIAKGTAKAGMIPIFNAYLVIYKDEPNSTYLYQKSHIKDKYIVYAIETEIGDKTYPRKIVKYDDKGNLMNVTLVIGLERFVFDKDQNLLGQWLGEDGKLTDYKIFQFKQKIIYSAP